MQATDIASFSEGIWYCALMFAALLGLGVGLRFWFTVLRG